MIILIVICIASFISSTKCQQPVYYRSTPKHGTNNSTMNSFSCPANGAITAIICHTGRYISQMEFVCSSSEGITSFGPYGIPSDNLVKLKSQLDSTKVNEDLKGDGTKVDTVVHGTDTEEFPTFDDVAYSNGARPVGVKIWTSDGVDAIQFDYANSPVELCSGNCTEYKEESAPLHGSTEGDLTVFSCPDQGVITALTTQFDDERVVSVQFTCTSGLGVTVLPRIGPNEGRETTVRCPPGTIIGSMHGRNWTWIIALGIRCVEFNETGSSPKYDAQGGTRGIEFDDEEFSNRGWRPVQIRVYHDNDISGIQVKYGNSPVSTNCKVNSIEVTDDSVQAKSDGFEVIGVSSATSCGLDRRLLKLEYSREVSEEVGIDTTDGGDVNWGTELSISASTGFNLFGVNAEVTVGLSQSVGGSKSWSTTSSNSSAKSTGASAGTDVYYQAPGACIIVGYVDRYIIDRDNVAAKYHYTCQIGELPPKLANIKLKSTTYGNAYFEDFQFKYTDKSKCTRESRTCVKTLNANTILADSTAFEKSFYDCFPPNSGEGKRNMNKRKCKT